MDEFGGSYTIAVVCYKPSTTKRSDKNRRYEYAYFSPSLVITIGNMSMIPDYL